MVNFRTRPARGKISRRTFLQYSAIAAGIWSSPSILADRSPANKLNIGIIGVGGKGAENLKHVASENIVALCDIDARSLRAAAARYPRARQYSDFRKLLEQKDLDAVVISTPDHTHAVATLMAIKLGKHVYCEKPLTHTIDEARRVTQAAREYKVATQMGNSGHSSDGVRSLVEWVQAGVIGTVHEVHAWSNRPIWPQGLTRPADTPPVPDHVAWDLWLGPAEVRPWNPAYHPFNWRGWWDFGTGALGDMGCHIMDGPFWALDLGQPSTIDAESGPMTQESPPKWSVIRYEFPSNQRRSAVRLTWYDGGKKPEPGVGGLSSRYRLPKQA
jgi:predicted dehydrogenase